MDIAVAVHWLTDTTLECLLFSSINAIYHEFDLQTQKSVFELSPSNFGLDSILRKTVKYGKMKQQHLLQQQN